MTEQDAGQRAEAAAGSPDRIITAWLEAFDAALSRGAIDDAAALFATESYWRDLVAFTWNIMTAEGQRAIRDMLHATLGSTKPRHWHLAGAAMGTPEQAEGWIVFETAFGRGEGFIRVRDGKCWTLLTTLQELKGFEEPLGRRRVRGAPTGIERGQQNWLERRRSETEALGRDEQPHVLIVGGGQGGLGLGARLRMLNVSTIVIDRLPRVGDQWRSRYESLCLHDPVWFDHLPYLPFPDHWPIFTAKDKMAEWLEIYAKIMELDVWNGTECIGARYDDGRGEWEVTVRRDGQDVILRPRELVFAMGVSGKPRIPAFPGADLFKGPALHSSAYVGGKAFAGMRVAVIGSNNSAHDICADLWEHGANPVMIQRSSTLVVRCDSILDVNMAPLYSEDALASGISLHRADLIMASIPYRLLADFQRPLAEEVARRDADFYARLEKVGFLHDFGEDGSGLYPKYVRSASGYYIDVGASDLIADGRIGLQSGVEIECLSETGILLSDGSTVEADAIVYATGFGTMDEWARALLPPESAAKIGRCWGYGSGMCNDPGPWVGELRNMWKPLEQQGLWFHGGNLFSGRLYSKFLALQLKAREQGLPITVYQAPGTRSAP